MSGIWSLILTSRAKAARILALSFAFVFLSSPLYASNLKKWSW